jgi:phosphoadenosine phosphosulfate reductase
MNKILLRKVKLIEEQLDSYQSLGKKIFVTSSFQTHSIPLLHVVSSFDKKIPIYFLNTGFHFPQTIIFKNQITKLLDLNVISLSSYTSKINQRNKQGAFLYGHDIDYCCHINKVLPLEPILASHDVWVTGVRKSQNSNRATMEFEAQGPFDTTRFHPVLDWSAKEIFMYRQHYELPEHPLEELGYLSVGCEPCTSKLLDSGRDGRWNGMKKNECGLHTELIK